MSLHTRRAFLEFMGRGAQAIALGPLISCAPVKRTPQAAISQLDPMRPDTLHTVSGLDAHILMRTDDPINGGTERFGGSSDFIAFKSDGPDSAILWVNHESPESWYYRGVPNDAAGKDRSHFEEQRRTVGGSVVSIRRSTVTGLWKHDPEGSRNFRLDGTTRIPFTGGQPARGSQTAVGTFANCAGGQTPWGTFLSCEENYDLYYGERNRKSSASDARTYNKKGFGWEKFDNQPPENYGWVVEIDPVNQTAHKLLALGRFAHEAACVRELHDKRCVVYSGDDTKFGCFYKFVGTKPGSLKEGDLYVADTDNGRWIPLLWNTHETLRKNFKDQTEVLTYAREAGRLVGGTQLDRPEGIALDPHDGAVVVALSNNKERDNHYGSIARIYDGPTTSAPEPDGMRLKFDQLLLGGDESGLICPDNVCFDRNGNLWVTNDVASEDTWKPQYERFGNNGLFFVPMSGAQAGQPVQLAVAPNGAELTGPCFSQDGSALFVSVQHPGDDTKPGQAFTTHWPRGSGDRPRSAIIQLHGSTLDACLARG